MEEKGKKRQFRGFKRKHFIIGLLTVCAIAVIAEAVLLVHTFSKEKKNAKTPDKRIEDNTGTKTEPTGTPALEENRDYRKEWKLISRRRVKNESEDTFSYEYDEYGRQIRTVYSYQGKPVQTDYYTHTKNGHVFEEWLPDKGGTLSNKQVSDQIETVWVFEDMPSDETGSFDNYEEEFDHNGNRTKIRITDIGDGETYPINAEVTYLYDYEYDESGQLKKRTKSVGINGEFKTKSFDELVYDSEGRLREHTCYSIMEDSEEYRKLSRLTYTYEADRTVVQEDSFTAAGEINRTMINTYFPESGVNEYRIETDAYTTVEKNYASFSDARISDMANFLSELYTRTTTQKDGTAVEEYRKAEFDEEGRPVKLYDPEKGGTFAECEYDEQGRFKRVIMYETFSGEVQYDFEYDGDGNLSKLDCYFPQMEYRYSWYLEWAELSVLKE